MRAFHFSLALLVSGSAVADYLYGEFSGDVFSFTETIIYTDTDISSGIEAVLPAGASIQIVEETPTDDGENWYLVSNESIESSISGFAQSASFATTGVLIDDSTSFLYQIGEYDPDTGRFSGRARVSVNGVTMAESTLEPVADPWSSNQEYGYTVHAYSMDAAGFTDLQGLYMVDFVYEACGYENRTTPVFWNDSILVVGPYASSMHEAGLFQVVSHVLLPDHEEIQENEMSIRTFEREWDENAGDYRDVAQREKLFLWNGVELEAL